MIIKLYHVRYLSDKHSFHQYSIHKYSVHRW